LGCNLSDHQACDELCKQDSYWYGHCATWDGRDFTCSCYQYKIPLNGSLCIEMQQTCNEYCINKYKYRTFCCYFFISYKFGFKNREKDTEYLRKVRHSRKRSIEIDSYSINNVEISLEKEKTEIHEKHFSSFNWQKQYTGLEGGYCYVYASWTAPNGTTQCKCFEELLQPVR
uniref:Uncharacterized protein n=1 Tax=Onchocerca volvulus TaxID=6282 RepID=A0A8R1TIV1_ONCVO